MTSNSYRFAPVSSKANAFNSIQHQLDIGDSSASLTMNLEEFGGAFDPIDILSRWKISQRQQAATKLAADSLAAKSGSGPIKNCAKMSSCYNFPPQNKYYMPNYFGNDQLGACGVTADFGSNGLISKSRSPDCLLYTTNTSNTETSVEDDGISMIFTDDSKSLWDVNTDNAVSSGESAIDANDCNNIQCPVNDNDETITRTSLYHPHNNPIRCLEARRYMAKNSYDQALLESAADSSTKDSKLISEKDQSKSKKSRSEHKLPSSSNINFQLVSSSAYSVDEPDSEATAQMKEMIYRAAAFRPLTSVDMEVIMEKKPKRKNVRISTDPQTAAARRRRERISERIRLLQKLVPGGTKMDTASMLDEAANYLKFLRTQVKALEDFGYKIDPINISTNNFSSLSSIPFNYPFPMQPHLPLLNLNPIHHPKS